MDVRNIFNKFKRYRDNQNDININEVNEIRKINTDAILLDVRSPQEFSEGHLNRSNKYTAI